MLILAILLINVIMDQLCIAAFNTRSLSGNKLYVNDLLVKNDVDIMCLSEHRLYESELHKLDDINPNYNSYGKSSGDLLNCNQNKKPGHCGIALLWKNSLNNKIRTIECRSDRICVIEVLNSYFSRSVFIVGVYLPHQTCKIANFEEHLNILSDIIAQCSTNGEVIVIGDTNCHFGQDIGERFYGKTTRNAKSLYTVINAANLVILDSNRSSCKGPTYTFNVDNVGRSYIDHCFVSHLISLNAKCTILDEDVSNMSDHLPILTTIKSCNFVLSESHKQLLYKAKVAWHKLSDQEKKIKYTDPLDELLVPIEQDLSKCYNGIKEVTHTCIDSALDSIVRCIKQQSKLLPQTKYKKQLKPYWTLELSMLSKKSKSAWRMWKEAGCPRSGDIYKQYKQCKNEFRSALRETEVKYEMQNMEDITKNQEIDHRYFWKLVNKRKHNKNNVHPLKLVDGNIVTDSQDICNAWKEYFSKLYTPVDKPEFDNEFKVYVECALKKMEIESYDMAENLLGDFITESEMNLIVNSLKNNKAPGWDTISAEHVKYGGPRLRMCLRYLFGVLVKYEYIPNHFKLGIIIPIPKGDKCKSDQNNYRGITLIPAVCKTV